MKADPALLAYRRRRTLIASGTVAMVAVATGMAFASVPLYRLFCQATGYGGTTQVAEGAAAKTGARSLTVRFDANVASGLPWSFEPETPSVTVRSGQTATVYFHVKNRSDRETLADARYNVTPDVVGPYFDKINCFCFTTQHLGPREEADMPVVFFLNPALEEDETMNAVDTVTLSYTFFAQKGSPAAQASGNGGAPQPRL